MCYAKPALAVFLCLLLLSADCMAGLNKDKSMYVGGTIKEIPAKTTAPLNVDGTKVVVFHWDKGEWSIPYASVTNLAYGQHAGRRVGATIAWGATTLGIMALPMLLSKKRRHYLTIEYTDAKNQPEAAIFEIGKDAIRTTLTVLEVRTGKKVAYEDEEAKKAGVK